MFIVITHAIRLFNNTNATTTTINNKNIIVIIRLIIIFNSAFKMSELVHMFIFSLLIKRNNKKK